jgi:prolipoprotein diacylglyceryl transferase
VLAFIFGIYITKKLFVRDGVNPELVDTAFIYVFIGTVLGARLGHVFFYGWEYYSKHIGEIFMIWEGGLASHGAAVGIILSIWLFSKYALKKPMIWMLDRVVIPVALAGAFIRLGNLANHEIYGRPTDLPWGFIFTELNDGVARHPSQIYEALMCIVIFVLLLYLFFRTDYRNKPGFLFGVFLVVLFVFRFFVEFLKENQEAFEDTLAINMGQILSIPFVLAGVWFIVAGLRKKD